MSLSETFLAAVPSGAGEILATSPELEATLRGMLATAGVEWPSLALPPDVFVRHLAKRVPPNATCATVAALRAADLYLACACGSGDPAALALFDERCLKDTRRLLARVAVAGISDEDVMQMVRVKLFVGDGGRGPKIGDYAGKGELRNWTRVILTRVVLDLVREAGPERHITLDEAAAEGSASRIDPETAYLKEHYRAEFKAAFEEAARSLSKRERNLLRHQVVFGLSIEQIAAIYHVHRATAARWLADARALLSGRTRAALFARIEVSRGQIESILRLIESHVELSLQRVLAA